VTDMFAYEREADSALVVGAGILPSWVAEQPGVRVRDLRTHYGSLSLTMQQRDERTVHVGLSAGLRMPAGGIVLHTPLDRPLRSARIDGRRVPVSGNTLVVRRAPAAVVLEH